METDGADGVELAWSVSERDPFSVSSSLLAVSSSRIVTHLPQNTFISTFISTSVTTGRLRPALTVSLLNNLGQLIYQLPPSPPRFLWRYGE